MHSCASNLKKNIDLPSGSNAMYMLKDSLACLSKNGHWTSILMVIHKVQTPLSCRGIRLRMILRSKVWTSTHGDMEDLFFSSKGPREDKLNGAEV